MNETTKPEEPTAEAGRVDPVVRVLSNSLKQWELFRNEMQDHQDRMVDLAASFLELGAFEDAAKCAIKAEGIQYVLGRMPKFAL